MPKRATYRELVIKDRMSVIANEEVSVDLSATGGEVLFIRYWRQGIMMGNMFVNREDAKKLRDLINEGLESE